MAKRIVDEEMRFQVIINGDAAQKELYNLEKSTRSLTKENKDLRAERAKLSAQGKRNSTEYKNLTAKIKENSATLEVNKGRMQALQKQIGVTGLTMAQLRKRASTLRLQLQNMVPGSAMYKRLQADLKAVNAQLFKLRTGAKATQSSLSKVAGGFNKYTAMGASIIAAVSGVVLSGQKIIDYNGKLADSMSNVQKTTGLNKKEINDLTKELGAFSTRTSRIELLKLGEEAGRLGIKGKDNILAFIEQANKIKVALGDDLGDEAIRSVGKMVNVYKVGDATGKDFAGSMDALGSAINEVSASGANQAGFLVNYIERQAGVAAQARLSAADNLAYAATFDEMGQKVEVSATAMNKLWVDMFKDPAEFADIAGMSVRDFNNLLNTDSNEAMLRFLDGLNGNNDGLAVMSKKLQDVEVDGTRGIAVISALAKNTDLLRERQEQSNKAMEESTSLTNEYNLKNNNLAGLIDKITKRFNALMSSSFVKGGLVAILTGFAKLIGAVDNVNKAFAETSKLSFENATNSRRLANESSTLLQRYEALTKEGLEPTIEQKEELDRITLQLKDRLGESVMSIDAETGAFVLNTAAVREQIKLKRLAADEEAATMASRLVGVQERKKDLATEKRDADKLLATRQQIFDQQNKADLEAINNTNVYTANEKLKFIEGLEGYKELDRAKSKVKSINAEIAEQTERQIDLQEKLLELNFTAADANALINPTTGENAPKEGDTQVIDGQLFTFKNGKWTIASSYTGGGGSSSVSSGSKKSAKDLLDFMRENLDLKNQLIKDDFLRELEILKTNHDRKIQALQEQLFTEGDLSQEQIEINAAINEQMLLEDDIYYAKKATLTENAILKDIELQVASYDKQRALREQALNDALAAQDLSQQDQEALREDFERRELRLKGEHTQQVIDKVNQVIASGQFKNIDLDILTEDQKQAIVNRLQELGLSLSEINALLNIMSGKSSGEDGGSSLFSGLDVDVLGFTPEQWESSFSNIETLKDKVEAAALGVGAFMNAWQMYHDFVSTKEANRLKEFEQNNRAQQDRLRTRLDAGIINQRQYNQAQTALEKQLERERAMAEYKQAKRERLMTVSSIVSNTAIAVTKAYAASPTTLGLPWSAIIAGLGLAQLGFVLGTELPSVPGYQEGYYGDFLKVTRAQDGKQFNAVDGGIAKSGFVNKPTRFLAGEQGQFFPELIVSGPDLKRMDPRVVDSLKSELYRVKGYEGGYTGPSMQGGGANASQLSDNDNNTALMMAIIEANTQAINEFKEKVPIAYLSRDMSNSRKIQEDLDEFKKTIRKSQITK